MFRLTIDVRPAAAASTHASREAARAELLRVTTETGQTHRVTEAEWRHTSYDLFAPDDHGLVGRATIDELCGCGHTYREHDEIGCTITVLESGHLEDCECRDYQPISADPALFDLPDCLTAAPPRPT
jgi:hypothetical protein